MHQIVEQPRTMSPAVLGAERVRTFVASALRSSRPGSMSALVALTTLLAIEMVRALGPLLAVQVEGRGISGLPLVAAWSIPMIGAAAVLWQAARRDPRVVMLMIGVALPVARLGLQVTEGLPAGVMAAAGVVSALSMLGLLATLGLPLFGGGLLVGVLLDAALHAALGTRSLIWIDARWSVVAVGILAIWYVGLIWARTRRPVFSLGRSPVAALPLVALGPVLVIETFMLGHLGWIGSVADLGWLASSVAVGVAGGVGVLAAAFTARYPSRRWLAIGVVGGVALMSLSIAVAAPSRWWVIAIVLAQAGIGSGLTAAVARGPGTGGKLAPAAMVVIGYLVLVGALSSLDGRGLLGVPVPPGVTLVFAGMALAAAAGLAMLQLQPAAHRAGRAELVSLLGVFVVPAALLVAGAPTLAAVSGFASDGEVRVATYNVALALDGQGRPNLEHVALVLAGIDADVIALQEVSRGYLPGGVDMVGWLQRALGMPHLAFQASAPGSLHGNAILSRFPIGEVEHHYFPRRGTALPRGAVAAQINLPGGDGLWFINAHLPPGGTPAVRAIRTEAILSLWSGRERTVVAADLNATAASEIVRRLEDGGLVPSWDSTWGPGETYPAGAPRAQIDWVLTSPDLEAIEGSRHPGVDPHRHPSDHLAVSVTLRVG